MLLQHSARRKIFTQALPPSSPERYRPQLLKATHSFLRLLLDDPDNAWGNCRLCVSYTMTLLI